MKYPDVERNKVRVYKCDSWSHFTSEVRRNRALTESNQLIFASRVLYRGHSDPRWRLLSRLERKLEYGVGSELVSVRRSKGLEWYDEACQNILSKFKLYAAGRPGYDSHASDDETWALGRHYGLITPLLDWTLSPYVAAFFAFEELHRRLEHHTTTVLSARADYVHVWGLRLWGKDVEVPGEFEVITARPTVERQRAQSGVFTRLRSLQHLDVRSYLESRGLGHCLELYEIHGNAGIPALKDLAAMNIHAATLFPDLTGAALQANLNSTAIDFNAELFELIQPEHF